MLDRIDSDILKRYQIIRKVGQGAYGCVWKAKDMVTNKVVALKKIQDAFRNCEDAKRTLREINFLKQLKHQNLTTMYTYHHPHKQQDIYISMQYMETDLNSLLKPPFLNQTHKGYIFFQIVNGIKFMHSANIIHRDLKPSNILINNLNQAKICDFGLVRCLNSKQGKKILLTQNVATKYYRSPQILLGSHFYGKSSDIWSLGCMFIQLLTGKTPFAGHTSIDQLQLILEYTGTLNFQDNKMKNFSETSITILRSFNLLQKKQIHKLIGTNDLQLLNLITNMLKFNPQDRLTIQQVQNHPYFGKFKKINKNIIQEAPQEILLDFQKCENISQYRRFLYSKSQKISTESSQQINQSCQKQKESDKKLKALFKFHFNTQKKSGPLHIKLTENSANLLNSPSKIKLTKIYSQNQQSIDLKTKRKLENKNKELSSKNASSYIPKTLNSLLFKKFTTDMHSKYFSPQIFRKSKILKCNSSTLQLANSKEKVKEKGNLGSLQKLVSKESLNFIFGQKKSQRFLMKPSKVFQKIQLSFKSQKNKFDSLNN